MQRYFVEQRANETNEFIISGENARHISKVMRMLPGDEIIVVHENVAYINTNQPSVCRNSYRTA